MAGRSAPKVGRVVDQTHRGSVIGVELGNAQRGEVQVQAVQDRRPGAQGEAQQRLDRRHVRDHQHGGRAVVGDDPVPRPRNPVLHLIEALPARGGQAGVSQPAAVQVRLALAEPNRCPASVIFRLTPGKMVMSST